MPRNWIFHSVYLKQLSVTAVLLSVAGGGALAQPERLETDPGLPHYVPHPVGLPEGASYLTRDGEIRVIGYNDMFGMLTKLNDLFAADHPAFKFKLELKGTRTAPPALMQGLSAFAPMGAEFSEADLAAYRTAIGNDPVAFRIAHASLNPRARSGPLAIYVHRDNPLEVLTMEVAARIFAPSNTGDAITDWNQLGLRQGSIKPCGLSEQTALGKFMQGHKFGGRPYAANFNGLLQSADAIKWVGEYPQAICFAALHLATPKVKVLAIAEAGEPPSRGSAADIVAGRYQLDRYLYIYVRRLPGQPVDPIAREYLRLVLSREGQEAIATEELGYLPLNASDLGQELAKLE
jgi:phosphate transport system substrate-binding protein